MDSLGIEPFEIQLLILIYLAKDMIVSQIQVIIVHATLPKYLPNAYFALLPSSNNHAKVHFLHMVASYAFPNLQH